MKKIILLLVVIFTLSISLNAQDCFDRNCTPYIETIWVFTSLDLGNGCILPGFTVTQHKCADGRCTFSFIPPMLGPGCQFYFLNPGQYLQDIMKTIMKSSFNDCKPTRVGQCIQNVEFFMASCWNWEGILSPDPNDPQPVLVPCDGAGCCKYTWQICMTDAGDPSAIPPIPPTYTTELLILEPTEPCNTTSPCAFIICE